MNKLWSLTKNDVFQSLFTSIFTSAAVSFLTAVTITLQNLVTALNSGNFNFDFKVILSSLLISLVVGILTGLSAFVGSLLKRYSTDEQGKIMGKF